jgi:hypothetical protein
MGRSIVLSYGGGRQTAAMCVAVKRGLLPRPDRIVMADTGRERQATWDYLHNVITPYLAPLGLTVEIAPHSLATVDLYGHNGDLLLPVHTAGGKLPTFCSGEWKRDVVRRYLRQQGVDACVMWLGYSLDEMRRMHMSRRQWIDNQFPLIDPLRWRVQVCEQVVEEEGLPPPPKSACWCCPHWKRRQWKEMRDNSPNDFAKACELDEAVRAKDGRGGVYLYEGRVPLALADLDTPEREEPNLFTACESGHCWT